MATTFAYMVAVTLRRKHAEDALRESEEHLYKEIHRRLDELATLNEISQTINSSLDLEETLTIITYHASRLLGAEATSVALYDSVQGDLRFAAASGTSAESVRGKRLPMGQGIMGWVAQNKQPLLVPDVSLDPRFFGGFDQQSGFTTRSILCVPLHTQDSSIGAIEAINKTRGFFGKEDLKLLTALAAPAAIAIENARFYQEWPCSGSI